MKFAGPFLDDHITKIKLEDLEYYDAAPRMYEALEGTDADMIIDKLDVAPKILHRFPAIGAQYEQSAEGVYQKSSN